MTGIRSALVTGASRGIGAGIARRLAQCGFGLTITARSRNDLEALATLLELAGSPQVEVVVADMSVRDEVEGLALAHR